MTIKRIENGQRFAAAVVHNHTVYIAGQIADSIGAPIEVQTREVLAKIDDLLKRSGTSRAKLLSVNIYLPHISDFNAMNAVWDEWLDKANLPARATVEARLAIPGLRVEMTAIAALD
ncbi:enamine deaminase RidA (YjgF/YER057c/UK114 family) [Devosia subaequoris]|uniref:Enamine deaminase RidA (YjgF/YER057c/UK114 family) n=1 Tax=Devosia subaequoris TaxID=395930 RepID=A0A7W6IQW1_9HYPH|nr:RidA family protein [Devosia subaequoris]MBB4053632.1 enamine deaminase RidA (YjgF/YER057c/UK114 family) [Devosia subaequoris]MCP1211233.1 RidA family protein [Devosia subaequoris]